MLIHVDAHSGTPIYRQIVDQVTMLVMTGQLAPGEQLDSVSAMSRQIRVNPMTVSKAYSYLVQEGLLERRSGIGVFVSKAEGSEHLQVKNRLLTTAIQQAATLAAQLDLDEKEAVAIFKSHLQQAMKKNSDNKDKGN